MRINVNLRKSKSLAGFTLTENGISLVVACAGMTSLVCGYLLSARNAEWSSCSAAAEAAAQHRIEQTRTAKWDRLANPPIDEVTLSNFPILVTPLDIPLVGRDNRNGTNVTTITMVSTNPLLKMIRVDCVWPFRSGRVFTNTIIVYRGPDQ